MRREHASRSVAHPFRDRRSKPEMLTLVAKRTGGGDLGKLLEQNRAAELKEWLWGRQLADVLRTVPVKHTVEEFAGALNALQPRSYSISSSPEGASRPNSSDRLRRALAKRRTRAARRILRLSCGSGAWSPGGRLCATFGRLQTARRPRNSDDYGWAGNGRRAVSRVSPRSSGGRRAGQELVVFRRPARG